MTLTSVTMLQSSYSVDPDGHRNYRSDFQGITDTKTDSPEFLAEDGRLPKWREPYYWPYVGFPRSPDDPWAFCNGWNIALQRQSEDARFWLFSYSYTTRPIPNERTFLSPLDEPETYEGDYVMEEQLKKIGTDGIPYATSAGEQLGTIGVPTPRDHFSIMKNTSTINLKDRSELIGTVNDAAYMGFSSRALRLSNWNWRTAFYPDINNPQILIPYIVQRFEFNIDVSEEHRIVKYNDIGTYYVADDLASDPEARYRNFFTEDGNITWGWLDGSGGPGTEIGAPVQLDFIQFADGDFSRLPLNGTLPAYIITA